MCPVLQRQLTWVEALTVDITLMVAMRGLDSYSSSPGSSITVSAAGADVWCCCFHCHMLGFESRDARRDVGSSFWREQHHATPSL